MAKGYWIARMDIRDAERYKDYVAATKAPFETFGAKPIVRGGEATPVEGAGRARNVVLEFESVQKAIDCYNSQDYQVAARIRQEAADGEIVIVEGV